MPLPLLPENQELPANKTVCDTLNRSYTQFHHNKYGGIPQAFVLNVIGAAFLIMVFSVLRRRAGDYARLALNHETWKGLFQEDQVDVQTNDGSIDIKTESQVNKKGQGSRGQFPSSMEKVYVNGSLGNSRGSLGSMVQPASIHSLAAKSIDNHEDFVSIDGEDLSNHEEPKDATTISNPYAADTSSTKTDTQQCEQTPVINSDTLEQNNNEPATPLDTSSGIPTGCCIGGKPQSLNLTATNSKLLRLESPRRQDDGFFSWIWLTIKLSDAQYRDRVGPDAVQYLIFQRYLICAALLICLASTFIVLPVNLLGTNQANEAYPLAFTTISNLDKNSYLLWVPTAFCIIYIILLLGLMKHFTATMPFKSQYKTNALMITNINIHKSDHSLVTSENIRQHLSLLYPDINLEVTLAYNVEKLAKYLKKLEKTSLALEYCEAYNGKKKERLKMVNKRFGVLSCCFGGLIGKRIDAQNYYQEKVERLQQKVDKERKNIKNKPLGIAFVVLPSFQIAKKVVDDFKSSTNRNCKRLPPHLSDLGAEFWNVRLSPPKNDIIWENLRNIGPRSFLRGCLGMFMYVILFIFVSSPAVLLAWFETFDRSTAGIQDKAIKNSSLLGYLIPPLLFVSVAVFMPYLIFLLDDLRGHWKQSTLNLRVMTKTYIYLLFMVVILPSVGLTSIYKFIDSVVLKSEQVLWKCIFLVDNGAFFTNYVITASLGGLCMELMRVCDLILYAFRLLMMKSKAERKAAIKDTLLEFPYGFMYAYQLTVMSTVIVYSILCPLITVFGAIYMLVRHFVDRYNMYFSYAPGRISQNCHYRAVNFVIISSMVMLMTLLTFSWIRFGKNNGNTIFLIVCASIFALYLVAKKFMTILQKFGSGTPKHAKNSGDNTMQNTQTQQAEGDPLTEENLGEITSFECPYLTFKPTWLSRQPTPTPRLPRMEPKSSHTRSLESGSQGNLDEGKSFTFEFPHNTATAMSSSNTCINKKSLSIQTSKSSSAEDRKNSTGIEIVVTSEQSPSKC